MTNSAFEIQVFRKDFHQYQLVEKAIPSEKDLSAGQILIKVDQFAFTSNNITYAVVGEYVKDLVAYWEFFPVSDDWGVIPVWGFGNVIASRNEEIKTGTRYYGYYPMGSHLILSPSKVKPTHFTDGIAHRTSLPPIYNNYINTQTDPGYTARGEAIQSLFRPLFTTSFLLDDFLEDNQFFGAENIVLSSASSKTAIGLAFLLSRRKTLQKLNILGLTSKKNAEFVKSLGYYDAVKTYDQISQIDKNKTVVVDFSGNDEVKQTLSHHLKEDLLYLCQVGMADWANLKNNEGSIILDQFFFAPNQFSKRRKEWGLSVVQQKLGIAWLSFISQIKDWISVQTTQGPDELASLYLQMIEGKMNPGIGHIVLLD